MYTQIKKLNTEKKLFLIFFKSIKLIQVFQEKMKIK